MYDFLLVSHCNFSSILYRFWVIWHRIISWPWIWLRGHSRSLKLEPFESLGAVYYSPFIVTTAVSVAVCEIFSVKEKCDLKNRVGVRSRSLKIAPFDRSHTSSYSPSIVTGAILYRLRESDLLVENREIFIPHLYLSPSAGGDLSESGESVWCW